MGKHYLLFSVFVLVILLTTGCIQKYADYHSGIENEQKALDYMMSIYGLKCETVNKWVGNRNLTGGRQQDEFTLYTGEFPFNIVINGETIDDYYPCAFMGNEISRQVSEFTCAKYGESIEKIICRSYVHTNEKKLLTVFSDINDLAQRNIEVSLYLVAPTDKEIYTHLFASVFAYLQDSFDDFLLKVYFIEEVDFADIERYLITNVHMLTDFDSMNIHPICSFEYFKSRNLYIADYSEIIKTAESCMK